MKKMIYLFLMVFSLSIVVSAAPFRVPRVNPSQLLKSVKVKTTPVGIPHNAPTYIPERPLQYKLSKMKYYTPPRVQIPNRHYSGVLEAKPTDVRPIIPRDEPNQKEIEKVSRTEKDSGPKRLAPSSAWEILLSKIDMDFLVSQVEEDAETIHTYDMMHSLGEVFDEIHESFKERYELISDSIQDNSGEYHKFYLFIPR